MLVEMDFFFRTLYDVHCNTVQLERDHIFFITRRKVFNGLIIDARSICA